MRKLKQQIFDCHYRCRPRKRFYLVLTHSGMGSSHSFSKVVFLCVFFLLVRIMLFFSIYKFNPNKRSKFLDTCWQKIITSLLNKFYKWPLIFVGPNFCHLRKNLSLRADFLWPIRYALSVAFKMKPLRESAFQC